MQISKTNKRTETDIEGFYCPYPAPNTVPGYL
jgi:hypothetical protein